MSIDENCEEIEIKPPIEGTFHDKKDTIKYRTNKHQPYVKLGSYVIPEVIICDVEAMGVRLSIEAKVYGTIKEILVNEGDPIKYDQVLFKISVNK